MTPTELLKTIYLGDRACRSICVNGWNKQVVIQVDTISRIRDATGAWNYYTSEDIPGGQLVFGDVEAVRFDPGGPLPNDLVNALTASLIVDSTRSKPLYTFVISISSVDDVGTSTEVVIEIKAGDLHLLDPRAPATPIRE